MGKQNHILCLSPVFQNVMGCGLKLRGLQTDLYAFFKQGSAFQICGKTSSKRTCVRGSGCKHTSVCCSSQGAAEWAVAGAGGLGHLRVEFSVIHWQADHHRKLCCSQHICLVWFIIGLASFSCLLFCFDLFCFNGCSYISAETATMASKAT